jgi:hypothetical protein
MTPPVVKRKRGRPPKDKSATPTVKGPPKKRGRPRKSKEGYEEWMTMVSENGGNEWEGSIEEYWRRHFASKEGSLLALTSAAPSPSLASISASLAPTTTTTTATSTAAATAGPGEEAKVACAGEEQMVLDDKQKTEAAAATNDTSITPTPMTATATAVSDAKPEGENGEKGDVEAKTEQHGGDGGANDAASAAVVAAVQTKAEGMEVEGAPEAKAEAGQAAAEEEEEEEDDEDEFEFVSSHINASIVDKLKVLRAALLTGMCTRSHAHACASHTHLSLLSLLSLRSHVHQRTTQRSWPQPRSLPTTERLCAQTCPFPRLPAPAHVLFVVEVVSC